MKKSAPSDGLAEFKGKHPEFWAKLQQDQALPRRLKKKFERHLASHKSGTIEEHAISFFRANKRKGTKVDLLSDEVLGVVRSKRTFVKRLAYCAGVTNKKMRATVNHWIVLSATELQTALEAQVGEAAIGLFVMWSYRNELDSFDPFSGIVVRHLPCRLGLPSFTKDGHYAFGHMLRTGERVSQPTSFDGELYDQWIPGGMTKPHVVCSGKYPVGLPELVHRPNKFKNTCTKLREIVK